MKDQRLEQHIAVFGESGSGKTVLLSSFYGTMQEVRFIRNSRFTLLADDPGQGNRLNKNYLGMRDSRRLPDLNRFAATSYAFTVRMKQQGIGAVKPVKAGKVIKTGQTESLRLIWHDYPGEWFEQDVSGPEEAQRRIDTFRSLLVSDVALLLVDGQRLLDNAGQEASYLKSLFGNIRNMVLLLKDDLLEDGAPLVRFPRIWVIALSKADLLPGMDVWRFRDLLIEKAGDDVTELRRVLADLLQASDALSVGEDFMLLSSAKFEADRIDVTERVGLDLILPLAAILPLERFARWSELTLLPVKVAKQLIGHLDIMIALLLGKFTVFSRIAPLMRHGLVFGQGKLADLHEKAQARNESLKSVLAAFMLDLDRGEEGNVLLRSLR